MAAPTGYYIAKPDGYWWSGTYKGASWGNQNPPMSRPTGPGYVRYEDLYQPGDTVWQAMQRLATPAVITFPEGIFEFSNFQNSDSRIQPAGIQVPKICKGIVGSGPGTRGGTTGTIFRMKPNTSTYASSVPDQSTGLPNQLSFINIESPSYAIELGQFQVQGTDQGHNYHTLRCYGLPSGSKAYDLLIYGWAGDAPGPPGETFGMAFHGNSGQSLQQIEVDGRRAGDDATCYGAAGITFQNTVGSTADSLNIHHCRGNNFVFWQTFNSTLSNSFLDKHTITAATTTAGSVVNLERTNGCQILNCTLNGNPGSRQGWHISHSNDTGSMTIAGTSYSYTAGNLKVINPTWNDIYGDGYLHGFAFGTEMGNAETAGPFLVTQSDGVTHIPYIWAPSGSAANQLIT